MAKLSFTSTSEPRSSPPRWSRPFGWAAVVVVASWASAARATPDYPGVVDRTLQTSCPDPLSRCLICHTTVAGGRTATQPFALALRDFGLSRGRDPGALERAIADLPDAADSDGDGTPDKQELVGCLNPSGEEFGIPPDYGCDGGTLASDPPPVGASGPWWILGGLLLAIASRQRERCDRQRG